MAEQLAFESVDRCVHFIQEAGGRVNLQLMRLEGKESVPGLRASPLLTKKII